MKKENANVRLKCPKAWRAFSQNNPRVTTNAMFFNLK
jgi:hypothetical protein